MRDYAPMTGFLPGKEALIAASLWDPPARLNSVNGISARNLHSQVRNFLRLRADMSHRSAPFLRLPWK